MKKLLKWIVIIFIVVIVGIGISLIYFKIKNSSFLGKANPEFVDYLNRNKIESSQGDFVYDDSLRFFSDISNKNHILLLGENHGLSEVQHIDKSLLVYMNKEKGIRNYLMEADTLCAKKLNTFLQKEEKDTILLREFVLTIKQVIPQQAGVELYQKWSDIYDYNKSLPDSLKIRVFGIDKALGDSTRISRDSCMIINFANLLKCDSLANESFYGFLGLAHVLQGGIGDNNYHYFASRLKRRGYNVKSIVCMNIDSEVYMPKNDEFPTPDDERLTLLNMDGPIVLVEGINDLKEASSKNTNTLFRLDGSGSPYVKSQKLINAKTNFINQNMFPYNKDASVLDFCQYIFLLRNSGAITPLK